jgi:hypothetical protein
VWFESDRQFSEAELLEVYTARTGRKPSGRWLETVIAQGVHRRTIHGRPGRQGGRSDGTFSTPQLRLAKIIDDTGVAMFASPSVRCELVLRAWSWWGSDALPIAQARAALATCRETRRPAETQVRRTGRELANWFAGPNNDLSRTERKTLSDAHVGEVFGGRVEPRNREAFSDPAYIYDPVYDPPRAAQCPRGVRGMLTDICRKIEAACGAHWLGVAGLLRTYDVFEAGKQFEEYSDVRLEQARVLYRVLTVVWDDARPLFKFLGLGEWLQADWPRQHAYECLALTLGVTARIPTDVLAPLIERFAPDAAPDEAWPVADRDTRTDTAAPATTASPPARAATPPTGARTPRIRAPRLRRHGTPIRHRNP